MPLEIEIKYFEQHKDQWLEHHENKYALVKGEELIGTFDTIETAYRVGVEKFKTEPFLIRRIQKEEPVQHFSTFPPETINVNV
jgi:hypothetical protein